MSATYVAAGSRQPVRVEVRCDKGTFPGALNLDPWDALTPAALSTSDVLSARARLGGFHETSCTINLGAPLCSAAEVVAAIRKLLNVNAVNSDSSVPSAEGEECLFAGVMRKGTGMSEDALVLGLTVRAG